MLKLNNRITEQLNIRYPIIQAPMAGGVTSTHLVKESAENGVLGMIGAGYLDTEALRDQVKEIKRLTDKPFGVNVFVPGEFQTTTEKINNARELLQPFYKQYGINAADIKLPNEGEGKDVYEKQLEVLLEEQISAISFTFGIPDSKWIQRLKDLQIPVIGTATLFKKH